MSGEKLLLTPEETGNALGIRRSKVFALLASGEIPSIKIGRLRRVPVEWLRDWVGKQVDKQTGVQEG